MAALNRAVAVAEVDGPAAGLALVDELALDDQLAHAIRADLLRRLGRRDEARAAYAAALERTANAAEREFLERRRGYVRTRLALTAVRRCADARRSPTSASRCTWASGSSPRRHHLTASDAQTLTVAEVLGPDGLEELARLGLGYTPTWGTGALRAAIAATYETLAPEDVLVFAGAEEAMFWALQELAGPGDEAVVTVPNYQSMESVPLAHGATVRGLALRPRTAGRSTSTRWRRCSRPRRGSSPSTSPTTRPARSPTRRPGTRCSRSARSAAIRLFCDEVYRGLEPEGARALPQAADLRRARDLARRDVEVLRAARPADRLARHAATARCSPGWRRASTTRRSAAPARVS